MPPARAPARVWDDGDRESAHNAVQQAIQTHDDQVVPLIRELRPWCSWRAIAGGLNLAGLEPPGTRYKRRSGEHPGRSWSHVAVRRIALRHGIE